MTLSEAADTLLTHGPLKWKVAWRARLAWYRTRHHYQVPPKGEWYAWMIRAGRGSGKTRTGAEDVVDYCTDNRDWLYAIVAPTLGDGRDICIEGESGVLSVLHRRGYQAGIDYQWNRSLLELTFLATRSKVKVFGSEKPDRLRGPNLHRAWLEELASWRDASLGDELNTTWNNVMMALRAGEDPRAIITMTPRRVKLVRELIADPDVVETRGSTADNAANLAPGFLKRLLRYKGTRIGRQELAGELIEDVEGANWNFLMIDRHRWKPAWKSPRLDRVVVGVDPPGGATEAGIVGAGVITSPCPCGEEGELPHYAVLRDRSAQVSPEKWGRRAGKMYDKLEADKVIGEINFGGDMVAAIMRQVRPDVPFDSVRASRGKTIRAEPITAMYEQGRVHHVGLFPELEEEMVTWTDDEPWSPNRMDALVWALWFLAEKKKRKWGAS